ncbi:MAG: PilZ domain-containing protein [Candidatus Lernaella stagnicola]|nr:PilZ domain-containing protein [Candidatus Lernaella stagnicola]
MSKKIFTTGEVARLLGININTVIKWFDQGDIDGFRLPGSNERRIPLAGLRRFMAKNSIPMDLLSEDTPMRRQHHRVSCSDQAEMTIVNGKTYGPYQVSVLDVSHGGARLAVSGRKPLSFPVGHFELSVQVTDGNLSGAVWRGHVAHITPRGDDLFVGMRFLELPTKEAKSVDAFVAANT